MIRGVVPLLSRSPSLATAHSPSLATAHSPSVSHAHSPSLSHTHSPSLSHAHSPSLSLSHSPSLSLSRTPSLSLSRAPTLSTPLSRSFSSSQNKMNNDNNPGAIDVWAQHPTHRFYHRFLTNEVFASLNRWNKKSGGGGGWGAMGQQQKQEQQQQQEQLIELVCNPDTTVSQMDEAKVDKALICAWYNHSGEAWISNEEVMKFASQHPSRLLPVLSHSFLSPLAALQEIRGYFEQTPSHSHPKPVGVRIIPWLLQTTIDNARFYPIFAYLCEHRIPLFIQVGWTGPLRSSEYGRPIPYLENVLLHFPELIVVCGHIGQPWLDEVIFLTSKFENVYIDTSAYKPSRFPPTLIDFMKSKRGSKKVMYGTNYPMISFQDSMKGLDLDDETKALYLRGNAERVLFNNNKNPSKL